MIFSLTEKGMATMRNTNLKICQNVYRCFKRTNPPTFQQKTEKLSAYYTYMISYSQRVLYKQKKNRGKM